MRTRLSPAVGVGFDLWMLGLESAAVMAQRGMVIAAGGSRAADEAALMVSEKIAAAAALQRRALAGDLGLQPLGAMSKAVTHYRRKVKANQRRLAGL